MPENVGKLNIFEQISLISEWSPLLMFGKRIVSEPDPQKKSAVVFEALAWLSTKTSSKFDDELVARVAAVADSAEGAELLKWIISKAEGVKK